MQNRQDLIIEKVASIEDIKGDMVIKNCIRVYMSRYPDGFTFQIRAHKPITYKGKPRNMIATVTVTVREMENILKYMKEEQKQGYRGDKGGN